MSMKSSKSKKALTRSEIAKVLGVQVRRVTAMEKKGMPSDRGKGRTATKFYKDEWVKWYADNVRNLDAIAAHKSEAVSAKPKKKKSKPETVIAPTLADIENAADSDSLESLVIRMRTAEKEAYEQLEYAKRNNDERVIIASLQKTWSTIVTELTKAEKILPAIMKNRGEFGSIAEMRKAVSTSYSESSAVLDQVGSVVAGRCVGKSERQIKDIVDQGIADAKRLIIQGLEKYL